MSKFKLTPIAGTNNRVFVTLNKEEKVSKGGIIMIQKEDSTPKEGTVIAVSERDNNGKEPNVKVGDYILFSQYAGTESEYEGDEFLSMKETDIFAVVNK